MDQGIKSDDTAFSLVLAQQWEKDGNQSFYDLAELIKSGVPALLRNVVWSDLL